MSTKFWTEEKLEILRTYLKNGLDTRRIAKIMNTTYDAVLQAIARYGLKDLRIPRPATAKFVENLDLDVLNDENYEEQKKKAKLKWSIPTTRVSKDKKKPFEIVLVWPDTHVPHHNEAAVRSVLSLMDDVKFDKIVNIGDFLDYGCISHWNRNKHRTLELQRLKNDYIIGNSILDEMDKRLPKGAEKYFLKGNHEEWVHDLLEDMPQLEGLIETESQLFLKERGYKIYEYNDIISLGKLNITHGIYATSNTIKKHLDELKVNIMFGHTHTLGMQLSSSAARDIAFAGYNVGCLCDLAPDYMRNRPNAWSHGFAIAYVFPNGYFDVQIIRILEGRFIFNSKIYDGNIKKVNSK